MSRRTPSRPRLRPLVRSSQFSRTEPQSLLRAYELALPVVRKTLADNRSAKVSSSAKSRRSVPQTLIG